VLGAFGGAVYFLLSSRDRISPDDWDALTPVRQTLAGSPRAQGLRARLATGAAYLPFAPFLCLAAGIVLFPPAGALARVTWG